MTGFQEADLVVTELALFRFRDGRMFLTEIAPEVTLDDIRALTEARFEVSPDLHPMPL